MNKKIILNGVLIVLVGSLMLSVNTKAEDMPTSETGRDKMTVLTLCLSDLGKKYDVYFTIEEAYEEGSVQNPISSRLISCSIENSTLNEALRGLEQALPDVEILKSETNLAVVHLIDSRLKAMGNYPIDYMLDSINYSGPIVQLIDEVSKQVPTIEAQTMFAVGRGPIVMDMITKVTVSAINSSVRDVLTNYIPLSTYNRVLWIANTKLGDKPKTTVQFGGRARP